MGERLCGCEGIVVQKMGRRCLGERGGPVSEEIKVVRCEGWIGLVGFLGRNGWRGRCR